MLSRYIARFVFVNIFILRFSRSVVLFGLIRSSLDWNIDLFFLSSAYKRAWNDPFCSPVRERKIFTCQENVYCSKYLIFNRNVHFTFPVHILQWITWSENTAYVLLCCTRLCYIIQHFLSESVQLNKQQKWKNIVAEISRFVQKRVETKSLNLIFFQVEQMKKSTVRIYVCYY